MSRAVERRLHRSVFVPAPRAELDVEAVVEVVAASGWHVLINISGPDGQILGQRELSSPELACRSIAEPAALAIALMIDPEAALGPTRPPEPTPPKSPLVEPTPLPSPAAPGWQGALVLSGGANAGLLPRIAAGFSARASAVPPSSGLALELGGAYFLDQTVDLLPGRGAKFSLFLTEFALCSWPGARRVTVSGCAGVQAGAIGAQGYNLDQMHDHARWVMNLKGRVALSFRAGEHGLFELGGEAIVPLVRDTFEVSLTQPANDVFRMSAFAGAVDLGVGYAF